MTEKLQTLKDRAERAIVPAAMLALASAPAFAADPTDVDGLISAAGTWQTGLVAIAVALLTFTVGSRMVRKFIK